MVFYGSFYFTTGYRQLDLDWIRIATEIELNYATFDAFVILHGTDTMAYTASALSFMLEDLGKTVVGFICLVRRPSPLYLYNVQILTGAQIPLSELRNDATDNFLGALIIASQYIIPGVHYYSQVCSLL